MNRERIVWVVIICALLVGGLVMGHRIRNLPDRAGEGSFRTWYWEHRSLDLAVQAGLILVGALGIAALLPQEEDVA